VVIVVVAVLNFFGCAALQIGDGELSFGQGRLGDALRIPAGVGGSRHRESGREDGQDSENVEELHRYRALHKDRERKGGL